MLGSMEERATNPWEAALIAEMRENEGRPTQGPLKGHPLALMHMRGAKTGLPRRVVVTYSRDGANYLIAGTAGGAPKDPAWVYNLRANPDATLEIGKESVAVKATVTDGDERARLWEQHADALPWFKKYPGQTQRLIPVIRLTPIKE
jgi:deazaflavin-dependent oxidoreductase (nitroreductase family)